MSAEPEHRDHPTGLARRRARRLPPIAAALEPDVELFEPEGASPVVANGPIARERALERPQSDETPSGAMVTAETDQGERERRPIAWPAVALGPDPRRRRRAEPEPAAESPAPSVPEPIEREGAPEPIEPEPDRGDARPLHQSEPPEPERWRPSPEARALLDWTPPDVERPSPSQSPPPFRFVSLPAVQAGAPRPGVYLAQLELLARVASQAAAAIERTGGDVAEALADDVRALVAVASWASAVVALGDVS